MAQPPDHYTSGDTSGDTSGGASGEGLERTETAYRAIIENALDAILLTDDAGRYVDANPAACRLLGYERHELLELAVWNVTSGLDEGAYERMWADFTASGSQEGEYQVITKDGRTIDVEYRAVAGILPGRHLSVLRDVTRRREAERELREAYEQRRLALEGARLGTWDFDFRRGVVSWDERCREIFGASADEDVDDGSGLRRTHPDDRAGVRRAVRRALDPEGSGAYEHEYRIVHPDGEVRWALDKGRAFFTGDGAQRKPERLIGTVMDVTDRKRAEMELRELSERLEERIEARTAELRNANRELESFGYSISHDLRSPLRGIDGFSQVLLEEYGDKLDDAGRHYLERVRASAAGMGDLIDALLALSRLGREELRPRQVDLSEIARQTIEELRHGEPDRSVRVAIEEGLRAEGDAALLRAALRNLLENAWKFTRGRERAEIGFGARTADGERAFFVRDNGAGFDMRYADKLFTPFRRLHSPGRFEGVGVGLATVQRIVHLHGGRAWGEAEVERGATFYFTLPEA